MAYVTRVTAGEFSAQGTAAAPLRRLDVELTERCNNACVHCCINLPANDAEARAREMTTAEIVGLLRDAAALGCLTVRFTGGEPLLREDFEELYLAARRLGLRVLLFTNATLVTPRLANLLARVPPREPIEVTLYGMGAPSYEAVTRVRGSFERAWTGLHRLLERGVAVVVKGTVLPSNRHEADALRAWAKTARLVDPEVAFAVHFDLRGRRDSEARNEAIRALRLAPAEAVAFLDDARDAGRREIGQFLEKFTGHVGDALFPCGAGLGGGCVDAYGRIQLCLLLRHPETVYDLRRGSLRDAVTAFAPGVRERRAVHPDYLARCARCFLKGLCQQCPAKSWAEHGTLDTPVAYFCEVAHAQGRRFGLLADGESAWEVADGSDRLQAVARALSTSGGG
jgi:radical SAM protein with 4Fe4S-binding SPASM domain